MKVEREPSTRSAKPLPFLARRKRVERRLRLYVAWIEDAKQDSTRQKRLATAIEWMAEGKTRNWKYQKK